VCCCSFRLLWDIIACRFHDCFHNLDYAEVAELYGGRSWCGYRFPGKITYEMAAKCEGNGRVEALRV